jgi:hypothetical protein
LQIDEKGRLSRDGIRISFLEASVEGFRKESVVLLPVDMKKQVALLTYQ